MTARKKKKKTDNNGHVFLLLYSWGRKGNKIETKYSFKVRAVLSLLCAETISPQDGVVDLLFTQRLAGSILAIDRTLWRIFCYIQFIAREIFFFRLNSYCVLLL